MDCHQRVPNDCVPTKVVGSDVPQDIKIDTTPLKRAYYDYDDADASAVEPEKKLCRYFYLDHCSKDENCSFMHSDFPCKFYYFGYGCKDGKNCKLLHGSALDPDMKQALWLHVMSAPANLLQRFPCFPRVLLKKNFDDRHNELIQMEQEGLLEVDDSYNGKACVNNSVGIIEPVSNTQVTEDATAKLGGLVELLSAEQISSLANIGAHTMDQVFQLGASTLLEVGLDFDTLIKVGNLKELERKKSIYTTEIEEESQNDISAIDIIGSDSLDVSLIAPVDQPVLTDQELLSILNEELNTSGSRIDHPSVQCVEPTLSGGDFDLKVSATYSDGFPGDQHNQNGISEDFDDVNAESGQGSVLKAFRSDADSESHQLMLYPSVKEMENDKKSLDSIQRTVDQLKKSDSLLSEEKKQNTSWASEESDVSTDNGQRHDSMNRSHGSDSDSQACYRMPFKSIINRYTPAKEIDASSGKFLIAQYKLIPVDIPKPSFDRIRRTFVTEPTYSSDPRIQLMFNIGPTEVRHGDHSTISARDPRLKKSTEVHNGDVPDHPA